jgi:hypothetical protein
MGSAAAPYLARLMAVFLPMLGITHLMRWEHACPDRLALAPGARRHKLRMAVEVSTPLVVVAAGVVALAGTSLTQAVALTTSAVAISGIAFVGSRTLRIVLLATATVTVLLIVSTT